MATVLQLSEQDWRDIFPKAPDDVIKAFAKRVQVLDRAGITATRTRLAYTLANIEHECGGFSIKNLTENINYTHAGIAKTWPKRFKTADAVKAAFGSAPGWQLKAFDDIYGGRMGNRPGTNDGSRYIGRGGPQITGRDGYEEVGRRCHLDLVNDPELATRAESQPAILAAFYEWKGLSTFADRGDFVGFVKAWNGGTIGIEDRKERMKGNNSVVNRLRTVARTFSVMDALKAILAGAPQPVP